MRQFKIVLIAVAILFTPAAAMAQTGPTKLNPPSGPWTAPNAGVSFPEQIAEYRRVAVTEFDSRNHGVGYVLDRGGKRLNTITVFVYSLPGRPTCQQELDGSSASIKRSNPAALRYIGGTAASPRGKAGAALYSRYLYSADFGGETAVKLTSDLYVYCKPGSEWIVKARTTWPATTDMSGEIAMILRAISWPATVAD